MLPFLNTRLRRNLLAFTFSHAGENFYVRELAGLIQEDAGNLSRELRKLEGEGLFTSHVRGNSKFYMPNPQYPLFDELKKIVFKTTGVAGSLKGVIDAYPGISRAFIYGSYAKEQENAASDVDLVVVGLESKLRREINFTAYTEEEFRKEKKKAGGFLNTVLKERTFVLKGRLDV
jgi:predicted nucleotidyltransferase